MSPSKTIGFLLWGATGFAATALALSVKDPALQPVPQLADSASAAFSQEDLLSLFPAAPAALASPSSATSAGPWKLVGVLHSEDSSQSKALLQMGDKPPVLRGLGDTLPQGMRVTAITKRQVQLEHQGQRQQLELPAPPP